MTNNVWLKFIIELVAFASFIVSMTQGNALLLPQRVVFLSTFFIKTIVNFWYMCPKIFAKLDYFATVSQMGVGYFALKLF